jgi:hypothetical protein
VEAPAQAFEVLLAEAVAVADAAGVTVGGAVSLDGQDHPGGIGRVSDREVDAVAADAVLRDDRDAVLGQAGTDRGLERVGGVGTGRGHRGAARAGVLQVFGQQASTGLGQAAGVDVVAGERADHGEAVLGPGGGDVEAALAAVAQQRAPLVAHPAIRMLI